ncbi:hypothetical protein [Sporomusa acidovorans]|uniref:Uncharacterized protein n=1 Tax=Sporomusa acidovorans (strain ATCC 49682 / DSM 3132 / Mol) TaxID=1123286 RepID=A0ABZ3J8N0_SPOA4|nr:hypothetical protein [Sporomusa acidovorans]OZC16137.1 hypothetical protein SPACI_45040 [Sporomusa acidovorans DSM 3132]SDF83130.1 hypothetical protein SAMN04488499_10938 [Sporomusa acidovorans]
MQYVESRHTTVAISTGDHKKAALYFDRIIPTHSAYKVPEILKEPLNFGDWKLSTLFSMWSNQETTSHDSMEMARQIFEFVFRELPKSVKYDPKYIEELQKNTIRVAKSEWSNANIVSLLLRHGNIAKNRLLVPSYDSKEQEDDFVISGDDQVAQVILANLDLIDTNKLDWQQIIEAKKDEDFHRKLRAVMLFIYKNYLGQSASFIKDDIMQQLEEYHQICKKHGFKLVTSSLSIVLNSKSLLWTICAETIALLSGLPLQMLTPVLLAEAALEVGKVAINYVEHKRDITDYKRSHPLSYILQFPLQDSRD